jgi:hypothetical protein
MTADFSMRDHATPSIRERIRKIADARRLIAPNHAVISRSLNSELKRVYAA